MNFNEWAKANPTKSLNDYYLEMAAPEPPPPPQIQYIEVPRKRNYNTLVTIAALLVLSVLALFMYSDYEQRQTRLMKSELIPVDANKPIYTENEVKARVLDEKKRQFMLHYWRTMIKAKSEGGRFPLGGGVEGAKIVVTNSSTTFIDEITVLVRVKGGLLMNKVCHTGIMTFDNTQANGSNQTEFNFKGCGRMVEAEIVGFKCSDLKVEVKP